MSSVVLAADLVNNTLHFLREINKALKRLNWLTDDASSAEQERI